VNQAITIGGLAAAECRTKDLHIHGYTEHPSTTEPLNVYGSDAPLLQTLIAQQAELGQPLDARLPYIKAQVIWAVRHEMARTVEDVLARRLRALFLDAQAAIDMAPQVAALMATELGKDGSWQQAQVQAFNNMAQHYLLQRSSTTRKVTA
jgi:glycerol-3-phosphate dehydrogenase